MNLTNAFRYVPVLLVYIFYSAPTSAQFTPCCKVSAQIHLLVAPRELGFLRNHIEN